MNVDDFLDSNVVLYAYDSRDRRKQKVAQNLLIRAIRGECAISVQVLGEISATLLHKLSSMFARQDVIEILDLLRPVPIIETDADLVRRGVQAHTEYGIHFYDGMIVAAAERAGCMNILSEDLNAGQAYFGVTVRNPFSE
jgi:predicted nucleic acid-binding protein